MSAGVGINHLSADKFSKLMIPLAPITEQEVIVEAVEDQLSVIEHLEADLEAKLKSAQALRQSASVGAGVFRRADSSPDAAFVRPPAARKGLRWMPSPAWRQIMSTVTAMRGNSCCENWKDFVGRQARSFTHSVISDSVPSSFVTFFNCV